MEVRSGTESTAVEPGRLVTRNVVVRNRASRPLELTEEVLLPAGWQPVATSDSVFELDAETSQVRIVSFAIPGSEARGRKVFRYRLRDRNDHAPLWEGDFPVEVRPLGRLAVSWSDPPALVVAGEPIPQTATVVNRGNCPVEVLVRRTLHPSERGPEERRIPVAAGATEVLSWEIPTDDKASRRLLRLIQVEVSARWDSDGHLTVPDRSWTVEVVPKAPPKFDPYVRLPTSVTTTVGWERGRSTGIQSEWTGRGRLNERGDERIDFRFRGLDASSPDNALRRQDEYGLTLSSAVWDIQAGDRTFSSTPLLRATGNDRGLGFDFHRDRVAAGGFVSESRREAVEGGTVSGYLGWRGNHGLGWRYHTLRTGEHSDGVRTLQSLVTTWDLTNRIRVELEGSWDAGSASSDGTAWRTDLEGTLGPRGGWHAARTFAGSEYHGASTGTTTTSAGAFHDLTEAVRLAAEWRDHRTQDLDDSPESGGGTHDTGWRLGPRFRWANRTTLGLDVRADRRERTDSTGGSNSAEHAAAVSLGREWTRFGAEITEEIGLRSETGRDSRTAVFSRSGLHGVWHATDRQTYTASFQVEAGGSETSDTPVVQAGLSGTWRLGRSSRVTASVVHQRDTRGKDAKTAIQTRSSWTLPNRHEISGAVRVAQRDGARQPDASVTVAYRIPLDLAVGRRRGFGTLRGTVRDGDGTESRPVPKAIVRLNTGETSVTDRDGQFTFSGLRPGEYTASVDPRSLGFGRVNADGMPQPVRVSDDSVTTLEIVVVTAATLTVRLTLFEDVAAPVSSRDDPRPAETRRAVGPLAGEVVELSNGEATYRRLSGADGSVLFAQLRPGRWSLRVYDSSIPPFHAVERPTRELTLTAGQRAQEDLRIVPRKRRIQLIDPGP